ncbi:DUF2339 domain-containing protein [Candidatus Dependentiae bacterium]|nr:DUF2339 domain-containing protein [Candidatus Dependentiae bacterium]
MNNLEFTKLFDEISKINQRLKEQEDRLKNVEAFLGQKSVEKESFQRQDQPFKEKISSEIQPADKRFEIKRPVAGADRDETSAEQDISKKSSRWAQVELNIGQYLLQALGVILFFGGLFLLTRYIITKGLVSARVGVYSGLITAAALGLWSEYLRKASRVWFSPVLIGALVLAYSSIFIGYEYYDVFSPLTAFASLLLIAWGSLAVAYRDDSRLLALLSLGLGLMSLRLNYFSTYAFLSPFDYMLLLAAGTLILSLMKRWSSVALVSFFCVSAPFSFFSLSEILFITIVFTVIPFLYALYKDKEHDSALEAAVTAVSAVSIFIGHILPKYSSVKIFSALSKSFPLKLFPGIENAVVSLSSYQRVVISCLVLGTFFLLGFLAVSKKKRPQLFYIKVALCGLALMFYTAIPLKALDWNNSYITLHCLAWLMGGVWLRYRSYILLTGCVTLELYVWFGAVLFGGHRGFASSQLSFVLAMSFFSVFLVSGLCYLLGSQLTDEESPSWFYLKDFVYAMGALSPVSIFALAVHNSWFVPYAGLVVAAYGAFIVMAAQGYHRVLTGLVGYGGLALSFLYALRYYFPLDAPKVLHSSTFSKLPSFDIIQITMLFVGLSVIGIFLYVGMQYRKEHAQNPLYRRMHSWVGAMVCTLLFLLVRAYIIYGVDYYYLITETKHLFSSFLQFLNSGSLVRPVGAAAVRSKDYILTAYYALTGLLLIGSGFVYKKPYMRLVGLALLLSTVLSTLITFWSRSKEFTGIFTMVIGGVLLLGASYLYQRFLKK